MLDTKANECACQCDNEVYNKVRVYLNFAGITSRVTFCVTLFRVK